MKFKLLDLYGGAVRKDKDIPKKEVRKICMMTGQNGKGYACADAIFEPGVIYETSDPTLIKYIKGEIGDVMERVVLTDSLKEELKLGGIKYTVQKCSTCTGAKPKAVFNPFEIVEED